MTKAQTRNKKLTRKDGTGWTSAAAGIDPVLAECGQVQLCKSLVDVQTRCSYEVNNVIVWPMKNREIRKMPKMLIGGDAPAGTGKMVYCIERTKVESEIDSSVTLLIRLGRLSVAYLVELGQ